MIGSALLGSTLACKPYIGGEVKSTDTFLYGRFEVSLLATLALGTDTSFFTYWDGPGWYWGGWNEIDIEIVPSLTKEGFNRNLIYGNGKDQLQDGGPRAPVTVGDMTKFQEFAIEWTPEYVKYFNGDTLLFTYDKEDPEHTAAVEYLNKNQHIMMNLWPPQVDPWYKGLDPKDMPVYTEYDYVRTYTYDQETKEFTLFWEDNFDTLDLERWTVSDNWTFGGNLAVFNKDHTYIKDGHLVFKLDINPECPPTMEEAELIE